MTDKLKELMTNLYIAENQFNWATGDAIDGAIENYNKALKEVQDYKNEKGLGE